jgi:hypothetical protein
MIQSRFIETACIAIRFHNFLRLRLKKKAVETLIIINWIFTNFQEAEQKELFANFFLSNGSK